MVTSCQGTKSDMRYRRCMEDLVMFQPDPDYEDDSIYLIRHADWPCGETDKTE